MLFIWERIMRSQLNVWRVLFVLLIGIGIAFGIKRSQQHEGKHIRELASVKSSEKIIETTQVNVPRMSISQNREVYRFKRKVSADLLADASRSISPMKNLVDLNYQGLLIVDWKQENESSIAQISFQLENPKLNSNFYLEVEFDQDLKVNKIKSPKVSKQEDQEKISILKDLVSLYAFYSSEDTTGVYEAVYKIDSQNKNKIHKQKTRYISDEKNNISLLSSKQVLELDPANHSFLSLEGTEETEMNTEKKSGIRTYSSFVFTRSSEAYDHLLVKKLSNVQMVEDHFALNEINVKSEKISWLQVQENLNKGLSFTGNDRHVLFNDTEKALKNNPELVLGLKNWTLSQSETSAIHLGIGVLASEGSSLSQKALVDLFQEYLKKEETKPLCHTIISAFTTTEVPLTTESKQLLMNLVVQKNDSDLATNASFAIGSALKKEVDPALEQKLDQIVRNANNRSEQLATLDAIGNSGDVHFLSYLDQSLHASDTLVRERAAFALRFIQSEETKRLIEIAMNDRELSVNLAGVKAIQYQQNLKEYVPLLNQCIGKVNTDSKLTQWCELIKKQI